MSDQTNTNPIPVAVEDKTMTVVTYALFLGGFVSGGVSAIIGLIIAYANRSTATPRAQSHYTFLIRTFWIGAAIMLAAVCFYFLSVKRWRDLARPPGLAGLPLLAALVDGAAHWVQPRVSEAMPYWTVVVLDVVLIAIVVWTARELGARPSRDD